MSDCLNISTRFNRQGTRLLCHELNQSPSLYDVTMGLGMSESDGVGGKVLFSAPGFDIPVNQWENRSCFAGQDDELVVTVSANFNLFVWPLPSNQLVGYDQLVNQPLGVLEGHQGSVSALRHNHQRGLLASAGAEKIIKLWSLQ